MRGGRPVDALSLARSRARQGSMRKVLALVVGGVALAWLPYVPPLLSGPTAPHPTPDETSELPLTAANDAPPPVTTPTHTTTTSTAVVKINEPPAAPAPPPEQTPPSFDE